MKTMFDKQVTLRMGQCNVKRWIDDLLPLVEDPADPLGVMDLVTHHAPLEDAPGLYETFQKKEDGCIKVVLRPGHGAPRQPRRARRGWREVAAITHAEVFGKGPSRGVLPALEKGVADPNDRLSAGGVNRRAPHLTQEREMSTDTAEKKQGQGRSRPGAPGQAGLARRSREALVEVRLRQDLPRVLLRPVHRHRGGADLLRACCRCSPR